MKKILFLLLVTTASYSQALFDKGVKITGGITTDNNSTKVVVQSANNVLNTIAKLDLQDAFYFATASSLPVTGVTDKIYVTRDDNKIYRFNGSIYVPLGSSLTSTATENFIPKVNAGGNLVNSVLKEISGNIGIGVGSSTPSEILNLGLEFEAPNTRKVLRFGVGGYAAPSNFSIPSNGDKIIFYNGVDFDGRFGVSDLGDVWMKSLSTNASNQIFGSINFYTGQGSGAVPLNRLSISGRGNVGIGTNDPQSKFVINSGNSLFNTNTDNGQGVIQANGNITASPATLSNQVVVKSQLDAADSGNVKITGDQNITGTKDFNATIGLRASIVELKSNISSFAPSANQTLIGTNGSFFSFKNATQNAVTLSGAGLASGRVFTFTDQSGTLALTNSPVNLIAPNATALNHLITKAQTLYTNQTITANKTVTIAEFVNNNELILSVNATSGNITITLPTFTALQGYKVTVKKMDSSANSVLIQGVGGVNIDGSATLVVSGQYSKATVGANLQQYIIL